MARTVSVFFVLILTSFSFAGERVLTPQCFNRYRPSYIRVDKGNVWVAYYDLKGIIHIKNVSKGRELIVNEGRGGISSGIAFDVKDDNAFIVWREKIEGRRRLWFKASYDGGRTLSKPILIDEKTHPLTRIKLSSDSKGNVFASWYGEGGEGADYSIYCISSNDFGRSFSGIKNLTLGYTHSIYPTLLVDENGAYVFSYSEREGRKYMIFRKTTDGGKTWTKPNEIKEIGIVTIFIEPIKVGDRLHVFWFNSYDGIPVIEGAYSDDGGKTWKTKAFEDTRGFDLNFLRVAHDSKGHIYLVFSGRREEKEKNKIYIIRSEDNGNTWESPVPLRHYPFDNTHAEGPDVIARENGEVVVVWVDYRNIRSNIYMQYSRDYGRTWQERDIPLEEPGRFNTRHWPYTNSLVRLKDRYYILAYRFRGDLTTLGEADLLLIDFRLGER